MRTVSVSELPESVWESEHFRLHPLAEGVYAAIATEAVMLCSANCTI